MVTGGAGFIGSHLVDALIKKNLKVHVIDNLSTGTLENNKQWAENDRFVFTKKDLLSKRPLVLSDEYDVIFHLAANPEVRVSSTSPQIHFQQNVVATYNLLETIRKAKCTPTFVFTSTSAVYGEPLVIPTPEDYAPLKPISIYAATKLACEALITAYAYNYGFNAIIYRFANVVGPRSGHGVIHDFIQKLRKNQDELEILGDGTQTKSYIFIEDCIAAMLEGAEKTKAQVEVYNIGSEDQINVKAIAKIVMEALGLRKTALKLTGGVDGGRGWKGDVKIMLLETGKIKSLGWKPKFNSQEAVKETAKILSRT